MIPDMNSMLESSANANSGVNNQTGNGTQPAQPSANTNNSSNANANANANAAQPPSMQQQQQQHGKSNSKASALALSSPRAPPFSPRRGPDLTSPPPSPSRTYTGEPLQASPRATLPTTPRDAPKPRRATTRLTLARSTPSFARANTEAEKIDSSEQFALLDLPPETVGIVLSMLDAKTLARALTACKALREAGSREELWDNHYRAAWRWRPPWWALSGHVEASESPTEGWLRAYQERAAATSASMLTGAGALEHPDESAHEASTNANNENRNTGNGNSTAPTPNPTPTKCDKQSAICRVQLCAPTVLTATAGGGCAARKVLALARHGDTVVLEPGVHQGPLVLPAGVVVRAALGTATVVAEDTPALIYAGGGFADNDTNCPTTAVIGITLWRRREAGNPGNTIDASDAAVHVAAGVLLLDSCSIVSTTKGLVAEPGAVVYLNTCDVSSIDAGVVATTGEIRGCNITGAAADVTTNIPGVAAAQEGGSAEAEGESGTQQDAPQLPQPQAEEAPVEVVEADIAEQTTTENADESPSVYALVTTVGGAVGIVNCRVLGGAAHGVAVLDDGCGPIARNLIAQNSGCGLCIGLRGNPVASDNLIADNGGCGVSVYARGLGCLLHCEIRGNGEAGVDVSGFSDADAPTPANANTLVGAANEGGPLTVAPEPVDWAAMHEQQQRMQDQPPTNAQTSDESTPVVDGEQPQQQQPPTAPEPTTFHLEGCLVHRNSGHGVMATSGALMRSSDCDICSNGMNGVLATTGSQVALSRARVLSNAYHGVELEDSKTRVELVSSRVAHSHMSNLICAATAHARIHASDLSHSECAHGVEVESGASVALTGCALRGNGGCGLFAAASTPTPDARTGAAPPDASTISLWWCSLTDNAVHGAEVYEGSAAPSAPAVLCELGECRLARNSCAELAAGGELTASGPSASPDGEVTLPMRRRAVLASELRWKSCVFGSSKEGDDGEFGALEDDWERAAMSDHSLPPLAARSPATHDET